MSVVIVMGGCGHVSHSKTVGIFVRTNGNMNS